MSDEEETAEPVGKASRRDRFKDALSRTKTKFKRKEIPDGDADYKPVHDDVEDFLARGRNSTSTGRPSVSESYASGRPSTSDSLALHPSPESIIPEPFAQPQPSPRRIVVPKIDVSSSQRWPGAKPFGAYDQDSINLLRPEYQARSQSVSSLSKGRGRARGLSVTFTSKPPIVIGEGGDEAQAPTIEISKIRARARSVSPVASPKATEPEKYPWGSRSPSRRKPLPEHTLFNPRSPTNDGPAGGLRRVPTGMTSTTGPNDSKAALEKEFEMSLVLGSASTNSAGSERSPLEGVQLVAPKPIHPPAPYPSVKNIPGGHDLKSVHGTVNLRSKFQGHHRHQQIQDTAPPPAVSAPGGPWQPPRFYQQQVEPPQYQYPAPEYPRRGPNPPQRSVPHADEDSSPKAKQPAGGDWI